MDRLNVIEHGREKCPTCHSFVPLDDSLAHVVPPERWAERVREERAKVAALEAQLEGAVSALEDAIAAVSGPVRHMPSPTYTPQISVERVERWRAAARGGQS